jgi:hypothetical protein
MSHLSDFLAPTGVLKSTDIGSSVQGYHANLARMAALTLAAGKVPYATGQDAMGLLTFRDQDDLAADDALGIPSQQSVKAYVDANGGEAEASAAQLQALTDDRLMLTTRRARSAFTPITPPGNQNWTPDWSAFLTAHWEVTYNRTINNPMNVIPGTTRYVLINSNGGSETIYWGSSYKGDLPEDNVNDNVYIFASLYAQSATRIVVSFQQWTD